MNELRQLVMRYVTRAIDLTGFREAFVREFLSTQSTDAALWQAVLEIESACSDFSEGLLSPVELKFQMSRAIQVVRQPVGSACVFVSEFDAQGPVRTASGSGGSFGSSLSSIPNLAQTNMQFA